MAKAEMGFFKVIVRPLYDLMNQLFQGRMDVCLKNLDDTIIQWEVIHNQELAKIEQ
jgi:calcium/calmodulin-dependent 3',5'-cyclic nucleotide phosphodiesterase